MGLGFSVKVLGFRVKGLGFRGLGKSRKRCKCEQFTLQILESS